jgi:predicted nucleotide-binding protein
MSISEAGELLEVLKAWKEGGLKFSRDSHPAVLVGSEAHALLGRLLDEQDRNITDSFLGSDEKMPEAREHLSAAVGHVIQFHRGHLFPEYGRQATNAEYLSAWISRLRALGDVISELGLTDLLSRRYCPVEFDAIQTKTLLLQACRQSRDVAGLHDLLRRLGADEGAEDWKFQNKLDSVSRRIKEACELLEQALSAESPSIAHSQVNQISRSVPSIQPTPKQHNEVDKRKVFVIYGRNKAAYNAMVLFLRSVGLSAWDFYELSAQSGGTAFIGDIVRHGMEQSQAVVALFTPDEFSVLRPSLNDPQKTGPEDQRWQARPNVIYEAGMAMGIDENRTILVTLGSDVSLFSDVSGIHIVQLDNTPEKRSFLREKLHGVGCEVDRISTEYLNISRAGDFVKCIEFAGEAPPGNVFMGSALSDKKGAGKRKPSPARAPSRNLPPKANRAPAEGPMLSIDLDQLGSHSSGGQPRRTQFRIMLRLMNPTDRNITLVEGHAFMRTHNGQILDVSLPQARDVAVPAKDGTVAIVGVTPEILATEDQVPKLGLVIMRIAQRPEPIRRVFDAEIAELAENIK